VVAHAESAIVQPPRPRPPEIGLSPKERCTTERRGSSGEDLALTQFEYVTVVGAILLGLALTRILESLRDCFDPTRRYWIHAVWVVAKLVQVFALFWTYWQGRDLIEGAGYPYFLAGMLGPTVFVLQVNLLLGRAPERVSDWRAHFWAVRRPFFAANAVIPLVNLASASVLLGRPVPLANAVVFALVVALSVVGLVSRGERVHAAVAVAFLAIMGVGLGVLFLVAPFEAPAPASG
jgi:hydrogenase/urease accessory protein HupE